MNTIKHCRFCAETKRPEKLVNLHHDESVLNDVISKLAILSIDLFNTNNLHNALPVTICLVCLENLNKACEFVDRFRHSQAVLTEFYKSLNENSDDDLSTDEVEVFTAVEAKEEDCVSLLQDGTPEISVSIEENESSGIIKNEPCEYNKQLPSCSEDNAVTVEALLDGAIQNLPLAENTLYAEEICQVPKRTIKKWSDYPWVCVYCDDEFPDMTVLRNHAKTVHEKCSLFMCEDCNDGMEFGYFMTFIKHVQKHRKSLRHICPYCNERCDNIEKHMKSHVVPPRVACLCCGEVLPDEDSLVKHTTQYSNHTQTKPRKRRKPGTPISVEELTCDQCQKVYKSLNSLRDHKKRHKEDRKRDYTCDRCGKTFYSKGSLGVHILSHEGARPHVCKLCNRSFSFPNMLRKHVQTHSGVKPYPCDQCGKCFRLKHQLKVHKIVHTDAMPFVCQYCSKAFKFKQVLMNHERQHTGSRPYACETCSIEFTNWSNYNKHMKRRHGTDTSKKKITPEGVFPVNPETGKVIEMDSLACEEWKQMIMIPTNKRGRKKNVDVKKEVA